MANVVIREYLWLLEQAFTRGRGPLGDAQSVLGNLETVRGDLWEVVPEGGQRSVRDVVLHVGWAKYMYDDYAFRSATMRGDSEPAMPPEAATTGAALIQWMSEGHRRLMESVRALDDGELEVARRTNWGSTMMTRDLLRVMLEHDLYHAGEINHIRSLLSGRDRWAWEQGG